METMTQPDSVDLINRPPRVCGHSTVHNSVQNVVDLDEGFGLDDFYEPTSAQAEYELDPQPIEAIETDRTSYGPSKWAGRLAVVFGLILVLAATVAAVTNLLGLLQTPIATTATTTTTAVVEEEEDEFIDFVDQEDAVEEAVPQITVATAITGSRIRSGPSQTSETVGNIEGGDTVEITGAAQNGWYPVSYDGVTGWTFGQLLTDIHTTGGTATPAADATDDASATASGHETMITRSAVNLRSGPSMSHAPNGTVPAGATVTITGEQQNGWYPVSYDGRTGFLRPEFLRSAN